jgi:hypothetical protein
MSRFLDITEGERRPGSPTPDPYAEQQRLIGFLKAAHAHNADILRSYGYHCPEDLGGLRTHATMTEPKAIEAARVIDAVGNVYRALFRSDKYALANAALWLGVMLGPELFSEYQRKNRKGSKTQHVADREDRGREIYAALRAKGQRVTVEVLHNAMQDAGVRGVTWDQARRLLTKLNKE